MWLESTTHHGEIFPVFSSWAESIPKTTYPCLIHFTLNCLTVMVCVHSPQLESPELDQTVAMPWTSDLDLLPTLSYRELNVLTKPPPLRLPPSVSEH